ncbi:MAG: response regulator [Myxococcales bacterium]|nr:response regulator [Myxococcales bacterium]
MTSPIGAHVERAFADGSDMRDFRPTVLVIDDDASVRTMMVRVLAPTCNVTIAVDGEAALWRFATGERFDVVLCDACMPVMDGAALVEHLRKIDPEQARRVIVVTGAVDSPTAAQMAGHFMIEKPFRVPELRALVDRVCAAGREGYFPAAD